MGINGLMRTGASGMAAQGSRLSAVADNIANSNTAGYKKASVEFSSLVLGGNATSYNSGGVETDVRYAISSQGGLQFTTSPTDLAVNGEGFFVVAGGDGVNALTRAGSFVGNGDGELVNAAGFRLLGFPIQQGQSSTVVANGTAGLEPVSISGQSLVASASTAGQLTVNLPAEASIVVAADRPSANPANASYSGKSSVVLFDNLGTEVIADVYFSRASATGWEVSIFNGGDAGPSGGFPYASAALATQSIEFDPSSGQLATTSATSVTFTVPGGSALNLGLGSTSQLAADYTVLDVSMNGNAPSDVNSFEFADDGHLYAIFKNGARQPTYRIPLATVVSPDQLTPRSGNVFTLSSDSGDLRVGFPGSGGLGVIVSKALEGSTVDLGDELTTMIEAQRTYTANSKVFQTGSELLDVLINLKR